MIVSVSITAPMCRCSFGINSLKLDCTPENDPKNFRTLLPLDRGVIFDPGEGGGIGCPLAPVSIYVLVEILTASPKQCCPHRVGRALARSEEHTSELQSLMRTSYAV